jgi:putative exporter of polyketide antibiotics
MRDQARPRTFILRRVQAIDLGGIPITVIVVIAVVAILVVIGFIAFRRR